MHIGTLGFPADQQQKLSRILGLSKNQRYELVTFDPQMPPDLLLLFGAEALADPSLGQLSAGYRSRLIQVSKEAPAEEGLGHIRFPLVSSRVIRTLDEMTSENEEQSEDDLQAAEAAAEERFSKYTSLETVTPQPAERQENYRVLVVDDNSAMQQALTLELEKLPATVELCYADNGEQALERVTESTFDFIFLDVMMPGVIPFIMIQLLALMALAQWPAMATWLPHLVYG